MFPAAAYVLIVIYSGVYGRLVLAMQDFNSMAKCEEAASIVKQKMQPTDNLMSAECVSK